MNKQELKNKLERENPPEKCVITKILHLYSQRDYKAIIFNL